MMLKRFFRVLSSVLLLTLISFGSASDAAFTVKHDAHNAVRFISKATLETVKGITHSVTATVNADLSDATKTTGIITVDLSTLDTGIDMRNRHMRERFLQTPQFPTASFELKKVNPKSDAVLETNRTLDLTLEGSLTIHGVTRDSVSVPARVTLLQRSPGRGTDPGPSVLHLTATFPVRLQDYNIDRPEFLFMKLSDSLQIEVDVLLSDQSDEK